MDKLDNQIYEKKTVKEGSKNNFCLVCMESTNICLYKKNFYNFEFNKKTYADWFYVCEWHLKHADFLEACESKEIKDLRQELKNTNEKIKTIKKKIDEEKGQIKTPEWLNNAMSSTGSYITGKLPFSGSKTEEDGNKQNDTEMIIEKKTNKQEIEDLLDNITGKEQQIKKFEESTKFYKLSDFTYMNRKDSLASSLKAKFIKKQPVIQTKKVAVTNRLSFPSAPTHEL